MIRRAKGKLIEIEVYVNGKETTVWNKNTVLEACRFGGGMVPTYCHHSLLPVVGNCRVCLVEIEGVEKPVASCTQFVSKGMKIWTSTPKVLKAREGVMEGLLKNHPLDCPICDQGGECDLQEHAMSYGTDRSRNKDGRRGVEDKEGGPLIKMIMTRCIHCTRCVRYVSEITGGDLGTVGRGEDMEISSYVGAGEKSKMSGNVVDLCPVGYIRRGILEIRERS